MGEKVVFTFVCTVVYMHEYIVHMYRLRLNAKESKLHKDICSLHPLNFSIN